jgi:hypothetical protein
MAEAGYQLKNTVFYTSAGLRAVSVLKKSWMLSDRMISFSNEKTY